MLKTTKVPLHQLPGFSPLVLDYINGAEKLETFSGLPPRIESFEKQFTVKKMPPEKRALLAGVLTEQYAPFEIPEPVKKNIELLRSDKTFTVTTGHQLCLMTGPLYFIYKIVSVIKTTEILKNTFPGYNFIPVFWMASEDHDFEEVASFELFGKQYKWENEHTGGPVGRMSTESLAGLLDSLPAEMTEYAECYRTGTNLAQATRLLLNKLFGSKGLVCLDGDHPALKRMFIPVIKRELTDFFASDSVNKATEALENEGYKRQVSPREINIFYINTGLRERLVRENDQWKVLNTDLVFSEEELLDEVDNHPERFSPNVILRPLYQETVLPNLSYTGGPGELAYWLQLMPLFDLCDITFPILMMRKGALFIGKSNAAKADKLGLDGAALIKPLETLKKDWLAATGSTDAGFEEVYRLLTKAGELLVQKTVAADGSFAGFAGAEVQKIVKSVENIEKKVVKRLSERHDADLERIQKLKETLFPGGNLQERHDNVFGILLNRPQFIEELYHTFDPFDSSFYLLWARE